MQYFVIFLLSVLNGVFAMGEVAFLSSRKSRLEKLAKKGNWGARMAHKLGSDPHKFLPTVQMGMTAVTIIAGAYGGTELADRLTADFDGVAWIGEYAHVLGFVVTVVFTSVLTLVIGELVPKTIGYTYPERIAVVLAPVMALLYYSFLPLIRFLSYCTKMILRLFRVKKKDEPPVTEEELEQLIEQSSIYGVLEKEETKMLKSIFKTADRNVNTIMTHRKEIVWMDQQLSSEEILHVIKASVHTYFPVCDQSLDKVLGIVSIRDVLMEAGQNKSFSIRNLVRQPLFIPESMPALELLELFRKTKNHIALVVNEYGSMEGLVTLHDLVESIFGNIPMSESETREEAVKRADGSWLIDGIMLTDEWSELLNMKDLTEEETGNYNTLGGFVLHHLGSIPKPADQFAFRNHVFEVIDMDGKRVDKVLITKTGQS